MPRRHDDPQNLGRTGEEESARYLTGQGYSILERRFRLFRGEIDIIALKDDTIVFVEVKTRARTDFGWPDESVTRTKRNQVRRIARGYLLQRGLVEERTACRFDVLAVVWRGGSRFDLTHYENAF